MWEKFSNVFQAKMHLMSECWRDAWSSRLPKNPKIQKSIFSNRIFGFRSKRWIFGFPKVFFGFFWILRKGVWIFGFPNQKSKKTQGKRWIFAKIQLLPAFFWIFWKNPSFSLSFFGFLISGLEKSIFFLGFFWIFAKIHLFPWVFYLFLKNPSFPLGFLLFLKNPSFSLSFFGFLTWKPKNPNTLSKNPKKSKKTLGNPKIHLFDLNPKILFEKMDFWIFGWTILRNPRLHLLDLNPSILVERWIVVFLFPFFGRISALKKRINQEWLQLSFDLREQASCILYVFFYGFFIISYCIDM